MPQETTNEPPSTEAPPKFSTPRELATILLKRLDNLILDVDQVAIDAHVAKQTPPSAYAVVLMSDATSLLEGISNGSIELSQPRIAADLIQAAAEFSKTDHRALAIELGTILRALSQNGIAAENCQLGRNRGRGGNSK